MESEGQKIALNKYLTNPTCTLTKIQTSQSISSMQGLKNKPWPVKILAMYREHPKRDLIKIQRTPILLLSTTNNKSVLYTTPLSCSHASSVSMNNPFFGEANNATDMSESFFPFSRDL